MYSTVKGKDCMIKKIRNSIRDARLLTLLILIIEIGKSFAYVESSRMITDIECLSHSVGYTSRIIIMSELHQIIDHLHTNISLTSSHLRYLPNARDGSTIAVCETEEVNILFQYEGATYIVNKNA